MPAGLRLDPAQARSGEGVGYDQPMKTSYLFAAILASSVFSLVTTSKSAKTGLAIVSALAAVYGLVRIYG